MTTAAEIADEIAKAYNLPKAQAKAIVDGVFKSIADAAAGDGETNVPGFGTDVIGWWHRPCNPSCTGNFSVPVREENAAGRVFLRPAAYFLGSALSDQIHAVARPVGQFRKRLIEQAGDQNAEGHTFNAAFGELNVGAVPFEVEHRRGYRPHSFDSRGRHRDQAREDRSQWSMASSNASSASALSAPIS
ncbi:HU family DNA-binding protein [Bradyrhizobium sp. B120]|uniref:HU family DNA-binding protein n=1 Tax=Bradyrhizobium sp. B120 TaxID=3410088 RepID=UPI003B98330C